METVLPVTYDSSLVLASLAVAILASYVALHLASRVCVARSRPASFFWLAGGAVSMGMGIWSMHFVGMLAAKIGIQMVFHWGWTALSLLIAVLASGLSLFLVSRDSLRPWMLVLGGVVMGAGIAAMHYIGMGAMQISPGVRYAPVLFALSLLIAVAASCAALWLFFKLRVSGVGNPLWKRAGGAVVMGLAIAGMHYTGMAATRFALGSVCTAPTASEQNHWLAWGIAGFTVMMLGITLLISLFDKQLIGRAARHQAHLTQVNERLRQESQELALANAQISEQSRALERLNVELEERVRVRTGQLQAANGELEAFSYAVAHDLRAPLSVIQGFSVLLAKGAADKLDARLLRYLTRIQAGVTQMNDLIEGLLSLAKLSRVDIAPDPVDLSRLAREVLELCQTGDAGRVVHAYVAPDMHCIGDPRLIRQVLANLIGNAWKFSSKTPDASIEVGVMPKTAGESVFFVKDNGAGFDMKLAAQLFSPFQRLHSLSEFEGSGIGLATVQRIVTRHDGRIWADAKPGQGATFYFTLGKAKPEGLPDTCTQMTETPVA
ncbi:MHYT domain-containing protein [Polaromonas sp. CG_9.5]|uniref:MHYT domain-containing protein n=1 Tax=Polaromonas sp. CG_9.5 TaxID=3071705 RepID=UPI002E163A68